MKITRQKAEKLGFELKNRYDHDDWETYVYEKGELGIDFTYRLDNGKIDDITMYVGNMETDEMMFGDLKTLVNILEKYR